MTRRNLLFLFAALPLSGGLWRRLSASEIIASTPTLEDVLATIAENGWRELPIGELMGKVGELFIGVPYVGGTLEGDGPEVCRIDLQGMDCVTYFENVLGIARMVKDGQGSMDALKGQVTYTRYRGGKLDGYASRLHYTSEWILDNVKKGVVTDITKSELKGKKVDFKLDFMSQHPQYYPPLSEDPSMVKRFSKIEESINARPWYFVPKNKVEGIESKLRTGDIVAITTKTKGLDYSHTGMINVKDGKALFMHASSTKKQVTLDTTISKYLASVKAHTGITVVRPIEP